MRVEASPRRSAPMRESGLLLTLGVEVEGALLPGDAAARPLAPMRGALLGIALGSAFWALVATIAWMALLA